MAGRLHVASLSPCSAARGRKALNLPSASATAVLKNLFLGVSRVLANAASHGVVTQPVTRRVVVAAAQAGKNSWIPAFKNDAEFIDPSCLNGSLLSDFGFDPLGLGKDQTFLKWVRRRKGFWARHRWKMLLSLSVVGAGYAAYRLYGTH